MLAATNYFHSTNSVQQPALFQDTASCGITLKKQEQAKRLYVPGIMDFRVVQQRSGNYGYVSTRKDTLTQFSITDREVIGLLAHNHLAGQYFYELMQGDLLTVFGSQQTQLHFRITHIIKLRALDPQSYHSEFEDLRTGRIMTAKEVFQRFYTGFPHLTLQTCVELDGVMNAGRMFIVAIPSADPQSYSFLN